MSGISDKYKKAMSTRIRMNRKNILKDSTYKENEVDLTIKKIINILYADLFKGILIMSRTQFIKGIENRLDQIISEQYPEYIIIKKSYINNLKNEINTRYANEYLSLKKALDNFNKNPQNFQFINNFTHHCQQCEKLAYHNCNNSILHGKFIQTNNINNNYVICVQCHVCYKSDLIEMYCKSCKTNYYSAIIQDKENNISTVKRFRAHKKLPFATWEKYHCGCIINEIMKCIKCKSNFYYDSINDKLICLNPKCKFEAKSKSIIWKCSICSSEFVSSVKPFNPLEITIYQNAIDYALTIREKARPYKVNYCNFCGRDISKTSFHHKRDCDGELLMSKLNNKEVVVCSKCHGMNFYSQYSWTCPLCDRKLKPKNMNSIMNNSESYTKDNSKSNNYTKKGHSCDIDHNIKNLKLYTKQNIMKNENPILNSLNSKYKKEKEEKKKQNISDKSNINISKEVSKDNNIKYKSNSRKKYYFSIRNLFMRNDRQEANLKPNNELKNTESQKNSNSLGKSIKKKTTLFDILQKRHKEKSISQYNSPDIKNPIINNKTEKNHKNSSVDNKNINNNNNNNLTNNINNIKLYNNNKNEASNKYTIREKYLRKNMNNNLNVYRSHKILNLNECENMNKNEKVSRFMYNKNTAKNYKIKKEYDKENKKEYDKDKDNDKKAMKYMQNHMTQFSIYNREKEQLMENKKKAKEEFEKMKTDNRASYRINIRNKILENSRINIKENKENQKVINTKKVDFTGSFRNSCNRISKTKSTFIDTTENKNDDNSKKDDKKNIAIRRFNTKVEYNYLSPDKKEKEKLTILKSDTQPIKDTVQDNNDIFKYNSPDIMEISKNSSNRKQYKSLFQISLEKNSDSLEGKTKPMSRRRYYQSLTKKSKEKNKKNNDNNNINIENNNYNIINDLISPILNYSKSNDIFINNKVKEFNLNTNTISNSNTNNLKDNNEADSQTNIDIVDFDINEEGMNLLSDSKRNSIINTELLDQNSILYSSIKIDELVQNCNIPKFNETDFIFENSIGEGSFGTIFEVEEIKTGNKYAIKKIICQDIQELIRQKAQLDLIYSHEHENIMKIYKVQIKSLDMTTYSISILMELALSDWNNEIIKRAKTNNFYKENELIDITKQIINGLLFLQKNNISHRDIKPQNILIFPNNVFKVADFGEAKNVNGGTKLRTLKGCELYMSPALYWGYIHGKTNLVHNAFKSDVFSLGYCLLYAMTLNIHTLEEIRKINNNEEIVNVIKNSINNHDYSDKFLDIIFKMIDIDEQQRYDFENLYRDIDNYNI